MHVLNKANQRRKRAFWACLIVGLMALPFYFKSVYFSRSVNLEKLSSLLSRQEWEEADKETDRLMLRLTRRDKIYLFYLNPNWFEIASIPCSDLASIDELWRSHSNQQKGFTASVREWETLTERIDWSNYRYLGNSSASSQAYQVFKENYWVRRDNRANNDATHPQEPYPSNIWVIDGLADYEDPIQLLNEFADKYRSCEGSKGNLS